MRLQINTSIIRGAPGINKELKQQGLFVSYPYKIQYDQDQFIAVLNNNSGSSLRYKVERICAVEYYE